MKKLILGANGPIGTEVTNVLKSENNEVVRFGRSHIEASDYIVGDALNQEDILNASNGCDTIYVTIGLKYDHKVWQRDWPTIIKNVIDVSIENNMKVVFFDNIYLYGPKLHVPITEEHEISPISEKGKAREEIYDLLTAAMEQIDILIVRASDFFGPMANYSVIHSAFLDNMIKDKAPMFLGSQHKRHSYSYTKDLARATVLLSEDDTSYNQVWHLPCYQTSSIDEVLNAYNKALDKNFNLRVLGKTPHRLLNIFIPFLKEVYEMRYQFDTDYVLSFDKFKNKYPDFKQTNFEDAINTTIEYFKNQNNK